MILFAATLALISAPAPTADLTPYLAVKTQAAVQEDVRQVAKTACRAEADGPQLALVLACAREAPRPVETAERTASAR
jgi:hypothetical protein